MLKVEYLEFARAGFRLAADFALPAGTRAAVIGPSGGGKSTLLHLVAGFEVPDRGRIRWDGADITRLAPGRRPVAMLFQDGNLFPHLDVLTNVALGASPRARPGRDALERAQAALDRVGLKGFERRRPGDLSGGQQSRAALARLVLTRRPVVLLDEPFAALGPAMRSEMQALVLELLPEATTMMVTHDPEDARRGSDVTLFVEDGRVGHPTPTAELFARPHPALARYLR